MFTDLELMKMHVRAAFTHDIESRLLLVNEPDNTVTPASRLFLGRTRKGNIWRFRVDLPEKLCQELNALCEDEPPVNAEFNEPPRHLETIVGLLEDDAPLQNVSNGLNYQFVKYEMPSKRLLTVTKDTPEILHGGFEELIDELPSWQPFVALVLENRAVSVCRSARITPEAHEAGLETLPEFRGNGYAKDVVSQWARLVRNSGATPLYSTSWENKSSQAVAQKLGLKCYGVTFNVT